MSIFSFLNKDIYHDYITLVVKIPRIQMSAIETMLYMERTRELSKDLIVGEAIDAYLKERVWATVAKSDSRIQIQRTETFGMRQAKNNPSI